MKTCGKCGKWWNDEMLLRCPKCELEEKIEATEKVTPLGQAGFGLLECPWCRMVPTLKDKSDGSSEGEFYAYVCPKDSPCNNSRMVMGFFGTKDKAIEFWNTRAF